MNQGLGGIPFNATKYKFCVSHGKAHPWDKIVAVLDRESKDSSFLSSSITFWYMSIGRLSAIFLVVAWILYFTLLEMDSYWNLKQKNNVIWFLHLKQESLISAYGRVADIKLTTPLGRNVNFFNKTLYECIRPLSKSWKLMGQYFRYKKKIHEA